MVQLTAQAPLIWINPPKARWERGTMYGRLAMNLGNPASRRSCSSAIAVG